VFTGEGVQKVDAKGRVSIPADYRAVLRQGDPEWSENKLPEFKIVYGDHRRDFLECFTIEAARNVDAKIARLSRGTVQRRAAERLFYGQAMMATVDNTGRIVLPQKLRDKLGITDEAYFIAMSDTFQIWNPKTYGVAETPVDEYLDSLGGADLWTVLEDGEGA
jgi:MraZ protein